LFVDPQLRLRRSRPQQDSAEAKKILVEGRRAGVVADIIEGRVFPFHPGFYLLHEPAQVDRSCQLLPGMDDQQVGHAWLHLSQFVQQDSQEALLFAREIVSGDPAILHSHAGHFNIEYQVRPVRHGEVGAASFRAGIWLVRHGQTAVTEQAVGDFQLAAQVQSTFWLAGEADFLTDLIAVGLDKGAEARGSLHPL